MKTEIVAYFTEDNKIKTNILETLETIVENDYVELWKDRYITKNEKLSFAKGSYIYDKTFEVNKLNLLTPIYRRYELHDITDIEKILRMDQDKSVDYTLESDDCTLGKDWISEDWEVGLNGDIHPNSREILLMIKDYTSIRKKINNFL